MLLKSDTISRFGLYLADVVINFIHLANQMGSMDYIIRCAEKRDSKEFHELRVRLAKNFRQVFYHKEMFEIFKEIETLKKTPSGT